MIRGKTYFRLCKVGDKVCAVIIDGGSESNCVSRESVKDLTPTTTPHPHPYKLRWLNDQIGNLVMKQCLVSFSIRSYQDQVLCDVLDMDACHVQLGRRWQHDRRTKHDGFPNVYTLLDEGKKKILLPLPPHKTIPSPKPKQPVHLISRKGCEKLVRSGNSVFSLFVK